MMSAMPAEQIIEDLRTAAALEHAHLVHHLRLLYAFGGDPPDQEPAGCAVPAGVRDAARAASSIAHDDMSHLKHVNRVLVSAGQEPVLSRATEVTGSAGGPVDLGPMTAAQFQRFPAREAALAGALDGLYGRIRAALASSGPPFTGGVLDDLVSLVAGAADHAAGAPALAQLLDGLTPAHYLLVTGVEPANELDRRLLALSDDVYDSLVRILSDHFADVDFLGPNLRQHAMDRMDDLHAVNGILGLRGLLPPFTIP